MEAALRQWEAGALLPPEWEAPNCGGGVSLGVGAAAGAVLTPPPPPGRASASPPPPPAEEEDWLLTDTLAWDPEQMARAVCGAARRARGARTCCVRCKRPLTDGPRVGPFPRRVVPSSCAPRAPQLASSLDAPPPAPELLDAPRAGRAAAPPPRAGATRCQARAPRRMYPWGRVPSRYHCKRRTTPRARRRAPPRARARAPDAHALFSLSCARARTQVGGCSEVLQSSTPKYRLRYRLCESHLRADAVLLEGVPSRFCQARARAARCVLRSACARARRAGGRAWPDARTRSRTHALGCVQRR
jgi:hypothetical protein